MSDQKYRCIHCMEWTQIGETHQCFSTSPSQPGYGGIAQIGDPRTGDFAMWAKDLDARRQRAQALAKNLGVAIDDATPVETAWVTSVEALLWRIEALEQRLEDIEGEPL